MSSSRASLRCTALLISTVWFSSRVLCWLVDFCVLRTWRVADQNVISIHEFRSAMIWILAEDGFTFSPHFPHSVFMWLKMHKNGTVYCPNDEAHASSGKIQPVGSNPTGGGVSDGKDVQQLAFPDHAHDEYFQHPAHRRPQSGSLTENLHPGARGEPLFHEFRTAKLLSAPKEKAKTGFHAVAGKHVGGIAVHKALALALASKKVPLMQCLTQPIQSVEEARERKRLGGYTQAELDAKRSSQEAAKAAQLAALEKEREHMLRLRLPSRDINGRRLLPRADNENEAKDVFTSHPLQVRFLAADVSIHL
jgi:hypothetical protein